MRGAWQELLLPPLEPSHIQLHGPAPLTAVAEPVVHRLAVGAVLTDTLFAVPQTPLMGGLASGAAQELVEPPPEPVHIQPQGPVPVTVVAAPVVHRFAVGLLLTATPLAEPHMPLTGELATGAEQELVVPPPEPVHIQPQGPVPVTEVAEPVLHRFVVGVELAATPLAVPHIPLTGELATGAAQELLVPPLVPAHIQFHGPLPDTAEELPALHRLVVGVALTATPLAVPHMPLVGEPPELLARGAVQELVVPPFVPAHIQVHGPLPATDEALPAVHRFAVGAALAATALADPHMPLVAELATVA